MTKINDIQFESIHAFREKCTDILVKEEPASAAEALKSLLLDMKLLDMRKSDQLSKLYKSAVMKYIKASIARLEAAVEYQFERKITDAIYQPPGFWESILDATIGGGEIEKARSKQMRIEEGKLDKAEKRADAISDIVDEMDDLYFKKSN